MGNDRNLVVDVNVVVDLGLELVGVRTGRFNELKGLLALLNRPAVIDGEDVVIHVVLTDHIASTARVVLRRKLNQQTAETALVLALRRLLHGGGTFDPTREDYQQLAQRCWTRYGTDTEDEAVVAAAERHHAAVLTEDTELRQYLGDRKVAAWTMKSLSAAASQVAVNA